VLSTVTGANETTVTKPAKTTAPPGLFDKGQRQFSRNSVYRKTVHENSALGARLQR